MDISEEGSRVLLDLADVETSTSVGTIGEDTGREGSTEAADAVADTIGDLDGVGESETIGRGEDVSVLNSSSLKGEDKGVLTEGGQPCPWRPRGCGWRRWQGTDSHPRSR